MLFTKFITKECDKLREQKGNITKRIHQTRLGTYESMWICIPKAIWSDTIFETFLKKMKKNKIPVKIKVIGEKEQEKVTGPALIVTPIEKETK